MRAAVVGHVEWVSFLDVDHVPAPGEIVESTGSFDEAAGGGSVTAVQLARLAGGATFFTALGRDADGDRVRTRLAELGVMVEAAERDGPTRRAVTLLDPTGERTIVTAGERIAPRGADALPWDELASCDAIYFTAGDGGALRAARAARVLVATPRAGDVLREAGVELDVLVHSANDPVERRAAEGFDPPPRLVVATRGAEGGRFVGAEGVTGAWEAAAPPGPPADAYGAGDSFAAGLTFALGRGDPIEAALSLGARCGAACLTGRGPYAAALPDPG